MSRKITITLSEVDGNVDMDFKFEPEVKPGEIKKGECPVVNLAMDITTFIHSKFKDAELSIKD